ncbi:MAG TPA: galactose oxidase early set domain-containing protein [Planctomycetota bacterium]
MTAAIVPQQARPSAAPQNGYWERPFQHDTAGFEAPPARLNVVHMALIPKGPHQGRVLVWDLRGPQGPGPWKQRWAIVDPADSSAPVFWNAELSIPTGRGDLFCAGHAWTSDGELLVAGGTTAYPVIAGKLTYLWDPVGGANGGWLRQPDMAETRWYPTVLLTDTGELLIAGGTRGRGLPERNDYEVFVPYARVGAWTRPAPARVFPGPQVAGGEFGLYPRLLQLETGEQFMAGENGVAVKMNHGLAPGQWTATDSFAWPIREHVNALLTPRAVGAPEVVWALGGEAFDAAGSSLGVLDAVESCTPGSPGAPAWDWSSRRPMREPRTSSNTVILPNGHVLVVGGRSSPEHLPEVPVLEPELFDGTRWQTMAPGASPRTYHSTAVLLPSGKVLTGGGQSSTFDYQVFAPPYVLSRARPRVVSAPPVLPWSSLDPSPRTVVFAALPAGEAVTRVVLVAPGSVTHHFDASQRLVELQVVDATATSVSFLGPSHRAQAPRGYYMLFVVTASGIPSVASWVIVG